MSNLNNLWESLGLEPPKESAPSPKEDITFVSSNEDTLKKKTSSKGKCSTTAITLDLWDIEQANLLKNKGGSFQEKPYPLELIADCHAAAFLSKPQLNEACVDEREFEYIKNLLESPEYKALHQSTRLNTLASEIACIEFMKGYTFLQERDEAREVKKKKKGSRWTKNNQTAMEVRASIDCHKSAIEAIRKAKEQVDTLNDSVAALSNGQGTGEPPLSSMDPKTLMECYNKIKDSGALQRIFNLAGRYRFMAASKQRMKSKHGYEDMVGIHLEDKAEFLLADELALLSGDDELALETASRFLEKETLGVQYQGMESVGKGPIVVCVDESGSMEGERIANAKAFALAMAYIAKRQKRWCILVGFSGTREGTFCALAPGKWKQTEIINWLTHFYNGGTIADVPLSVLPFYEWPKYPLPKGKTDIICITDGVLNVDSSMEVTFNKWKEENKVRMITIIVGKSRPGDMAKVSNEVHLMPNIQCDAEPIQQCLSI